jgi:hypothetical protein
MRDLQISKEESSIVYSEPSSNISDSFLLQNLNTFEDEQQAFQHRDDDFASVSSDFSYGKIYGPVGGEPVVGSGAYWDRNAWPQENIDGQYYHQQVLYPTHVAYAPYLAPAPYNGSSNVGYNPSLNPAYVQPVQAQYTQPVQPRYYQSSTIHASKSPPDQTAFQWLGNFGNKDRGYQSKGTIEDEEIETSRYCCGFYKSRRQCFLIFGPISFLLLFGLGIRS